MILQNFKAQMVQSGKTCMLNVYRVQTKKCFVYKNLHKITFSLFNISKLRTYLFVYFDYRSMFPIDLKIENSFALYL